MQYPSATWAASARAPFSLRHSAGPHSGLVRHTHAHSGLVARVGRRMALIVRVSLPCVLALRLHVDRVAIYLSFSIYTHTTYSTNSENTNFECPLFALGVPLVGTFALARPVTTVLGWKSMGSPMHVMRRSLPMLARTWIDVDYWALVEELIEMPRHRLVDINIRRCAMSHALALGIITPL